MLDGEYVMAMSLPCGYKRKKKGQLWFRNRRDLQYPALTCCGRGGPEKDLKSAARGLRPMSVVVGGIEPIDSNKEPESVASGPPSPVLAGMEPLDANRRRRPPNLGPESEPLPFSLPDSIEPIDPKNEGALGGAGCCAPEPESMDGSAEAVDKLSPANADWVCCWE
jgi:hypothetical protein